MIKPRFACASQIITKGNYVTGGTVSFVSSLEGSFRPDLPGRFNELDLLRREWPLFAASLADQVLPPYEVLIHPSSGCNLRCQWCIGDHVPLEIWDSGRGSLALLEASKEAPERLPDMLAAPPAMMKLAVELAGYRRMGTYRSGGVGHTAEFGVRNVSFSGLIGEPLIARTALIPAIAYLLQHGIRVGIFTNGVLMDGPVIDMLAGAAYVNVSLDAATADTYTQLKFRGHRAGRVKFERAVANLTVLAERRRELGTDLEINVSFVLYPGNHHEVYDAAVTRAGLIVLTGPSGTGKTTALLQLLAARLGQAFVANDKAYLAISRDSVRARALPTSAALRADTAAMFPTVASMTPQPGSSRSGDNLGRAGSDQRLRVSPRRIAEAFGVALYPGGLVTSVLAISYKGPGRPSSWRRADPSLAWKVASAGYLDDWFVDEPHEHSRLGVPPARLRAAHHATLRRISSAVPIFEFSAGSDTPEALQAIIASVVRPASQVKSARRP